MQYAELKPMIDSEKVLDICLRTGKSPKEVIKRVMDLRDSIECWTRAHKEYGVLKSANVVKYDNGSGVVVAKYKTNKPDKRGNFDKECRSNLTSASKLPDLSKYVDKECVFFVGYRENPDDGSVFRTLLDIEEV